ARCLLSRHGTVVVACFFLGCATGAPAGTADTGSVVDSGDPFVIPDGDDTDASTAIDVVTTLDDAPLSPDVGSVDAGTVGTDGDIGRTDLGSMADTGVRADVSSPSDAGAGCAAARSCGACTPMSACGWCAATGQCLAGTPT